MAEKICIKCGSVLPLEAFYKHPSMGDGHLNECKECFKKRMRELYTIKSASEEWMEKERARGREKFRRLGYANEEWNQKTRNDFSFPGISTLSRYLQRRGYDTKGKEVHHWNYNLPHSVFLLSRKAHHRIHLAVDMSREDKYCYTKDGVRLETAEQAKTVYENILRQSGLNETIQLIEF